jgi:hypothetical protein
VLAPTLRPTLVWSFPLDPDQDPLGGLMYAMEVVAADPVSLATQVAVAGVGAPIPPGVDVLLWHEPIPEALGLRVRVADDRPILSSSLSIDTQIVGGTAAGGALHYRAGDWDVVETFVGPSLSLVVGIDHEAQILRLSEGDQVESVSSYRFRLR